MRPQAERNDGPGDRERDLHAHAGEQFAAKRSGIYQYLLTHYSILTLPTSARTKPNSRATPSETLISRPVRLVGPKLFTLQRVCRPVAITVTVTRRQACVHIAHVMPSSSKRSPLAVRRPLSKPYCDAKPVSAKALRSDHNGAQICRQILSRQFREIVLIVNSDRIVPATRFTLKTQVVLLASR